MISALKGAPRPRIFIGVPAYHGAKHIGETLRSIQQQEFAAFEAFVSVDGADRETARACKPFLSDPRFRLIVQDRRLDWHGNINWLMQQVGHEFYCYWPQDDLATKDYLASLIRFADAHPDYVCAFTDIQWFEQDQTRAVCPSLTGSALDRTRYVMESMNGVPFRGLTRSDAMRRVGSVRQTPYQSAHEEFVWLAKLAREGMLGRVEGPLYYKRKHPGSLSPKWHLREPAWKRAVWIEFGVGMLEAMMPVVSPEEREDALAIVLERLCRPRDARFRFYDCAPEPLQFAGDFLREARARCNIRASSDSQDVRLIDEVLRPWLAALALPAADVALAALTRELRERGELRVSFAEGEIGMRLLQDGWAIPEAWGTWSTGTRAALRLPIPQNGSAWEVTFACRAHTDAHHVQTIHIDVDGMTDFARWRFETGEIVQKQLTLRLCHGETIVRFRYPDAISPEALGASTDPRPLALALMSATIVPAT
jgi:hypothetical protein